MSALVDLSDVINRATGGNSGTPETIFMYKDSRVDAAAAAAPVAGRMTSLWQYEGTPSGGAAPGSVAAPVNTTTGSLIQTDPGGGREKWLLGVTANGSTAGTLILYDRLLHISGLNGTLNTAQTVGGSLTRNTGGVGNQIWVEIYTQIGASGTTITASYTDQAAASGHTTTATSIGATNFREAQRIIPLPLAAGDSGVQAVASVTLAATTGTAGDFGVTVVRPLLIIPCPLAACGTVRDLIAQLPGPIKIDTDACLAFAWLANGATAPQVFTQLNMIEA